MPAGEQEHERTGIRRSSPFLTKHRSHIKKEKRKTSSIHVIDTCLGPGYLHFMRGRVDSEPEAGDFMPREKGNSYPFTEPDPVLAMLEWVVGQMMLIEAEAKVGAEKEKHSKIRTTHFSGKRSGRMDTRLEYETCIFPLCPEP